MALNPDISNDADLEKTLLNSNEADLVSVEKDVIELSEFGDVVELLQRLSSAENMAEGMEGRIDNVLQNLDNLLELLGGIEVSTEAVTDEESNRNTEFLTNPEDDSEKQSHSK